MMIVVERIEDRLAVLEISDGNSMVTRETIPLSSLSIAVAEGDVLIKTADGYVVDTAQTHLRRCDAIRRLHHLKKR